MPKVEKAIVALTIDQPALGQVRVSNELRKRGLLISPAGVCGVSTRSDQPHTGPSHARIRAQQDG